MSAAPVSVQAVPYLGTYASPAGAGRSMERVHLIMVCPLIATPVYTGRTSSSTGSPAWLPGLRSSATTRSKSLTYMLCSCLYFCQEVSAFGIFLGAKWRSVRSGPQQRTFVSSGSHRTLARGTNVRRLKSAGHAFGAAIGNRLPLTAARSMPTSASTVHGIRLAQLMTKPYIAQNGCRVTRLVEASRGGRAVRTTTQPVPIKPTKEPNHKACFRDHYAFTSFHKLPKESGRIQVQMTARESGPDTPRALLLHPPIRACRQARSYLKTPWSAPRNPSTIPLTRR